MVIDYKERPHQVRFEIFGVLKTYAWSSIFSIIVSERRATAENQF